MEEFQGKGRWGEERWHGGKGNRVGRLRNLWCSAPLDPEPHVGPCGPTRDFSGCFRPTTESSSLIVDLLSLFRGQKFSSSKVVAAAAQGVLDASNNHFQHCGSPKHQAAQDWAVQQSHQNSILDATQIRVNKLKSE